jgi:hypothetical protein
MNSLRLSGRTGEARTASIPSAESPPAIERWTKPTLLVVNLLIQRHLADPRSESWGLDVAKALHLSAASTYPILRRLQRAKWLLDRDEKPDEQQLERGRPPRTYFRINPEKLGEIRQALAERDARQRAKQSSARQAQGSRVTGVGTAPMSE